MPIAELKGNQLRLRTANPNDFIKGTWKTDDVGKPHRLQRIVARLNSNPRQYMTQSWRLNLSTYDSKQDAIKDLVALHERRNITNAQFERGKGIISRWFRLVITK